MSRSNPVWLVLAAALMAAAQWSAPAAQSGGGPAVVRGTIKSADGAAMEGIIVSARAAGQSFTTSVFSDRQGGYAFPPLDAGRYMLWAQAVGFEAVRSEFALAGARVERSFTLT